MIACAPIRASVMKAPLLGVHQVLQHLVGRRGDVQLGHAFRPVRHDAARVERHSQVLGLRLEEPPRGIPQGRSRYVGGIEDQFGIRP